MNKSIYLDKHVPIQERVNNLISQMTLEEKIGQCFMALENEDEQWLRKIKPGAIINAIKKERIDYLQKILGDEHRLKIPVIFSLDCIHGHALYPGATVFPTQLGLSCSWNPKLIEKVGNITAKEMLNTGIHWTFSPVLDIARDIRWGRLDETFGEDPYLISKLAKSLIKGYQGKRLSDKYSVLACGKHFAGYSDTIGGRDSSDMLLSERELLQFFIPQYKEAIKAGLKNIMAGYHSVNGLPCSANKWLLTDILRKKLRFKGFVVSDFDNIRRLISEHYLTDNQEEAAAIAMDAGNDMAMTTKFFPEAILSAVKNRAIKEYIIDKACETILTIKFELGLFDDKRYTALDEKKLFISWQKHRKIAYESAVQSIVLLKNKNNILPLKLNNIKTIALIGPSADNPNTLLGDWSRGITPYKDWHTEYTHPKENVKTILDELKNIIPNPCKIRYVKGADFTDNHFNEIDKAVKIAGESDVIIAAVGDINELIGEEHDRADLKLTGRQQELLETVYSTGKPLIVLLVSSKPLIIPWIAQHADALLNIWNPGMMGGKAIVDILFGRKNPSGKLTVSFPHHIGQLPVRYNLSPNWHGKKYYVDLPEDTKTPLFPFGFGLSYTTFKYSNLTIKNENLKKGESLNVYITLKNTGENTGTEIIQLYIRDKISSVTKPYKLLKGFKRITLKPEEKKTIKFTIKYNELSILNVKNKWIVEPGEFIVFVGSDSNEKNLLAKKFTVS